MQVDMKGTWQSALKSTDFNYGYSANDQLKVTSLTYGSYKKRRKPLASAMGILRK